MGLMDQVRADWLSITSNANEFGVSIAFTSKDEVQTATVNGLHTKHHIGVDPTTGLPINTKNTHISVAEKLLNDAGFTTRNAKGEVSMRGHRVQCKDSTGVLKNYVIDQCWPNETVGMLCMVLGDYKP